MVIFNSYVKLPEGITFFFTEVRRVHRVAVVGGDRDAAAHRRGRGTLDGDPRVQADPGGEGGDSPARWPVGGPGKGGRLPWVTCLRGTLNGRILCFEMWNLV